MDGFLQFPKGFATATVHVSQEPEQWDSMAVVAPLVTATTFKQYGPANFKKYDYSRSGNPSRNVLENILAHLEQGKYGLCFASASGATTAVLGLLKHGDHVISSDDIYNGIKCLFIKIASRFGITTDFVDAREPANVERAITPNTKMIWIETPTNPTLKIVDIQAVSSIAKKHKIILVVDNTFLTPYLQRPLTLGADLVIHSVTKYINGHSDVVMGAAVTNSSELHQNLRFLQNVMGIVPAPFDCYQVIRGTKTLALRMQQHMKNSLAIAKYLESHPKVEKVIHPGLPSHPQHELFKKQTSGHSGVFSFYLKGGIEESSRLLKALKVFTLAESLGGFESLAKLPSVMPQESVAPELKKALHITDNLVRLSVGLEDIDDLIEDLRQALENV